MEREYIVTKSNKLISANYDLSLQEQKIILTLASMVQPQDTEFKEYEFRIKDFIELLGLKDQSKYVELPKITRELKKKVFDIKEGTDIIQVSWLGGVRYKTKEGILILSLDKGLKPYMLELKELYTSYKLQNVLSLKSKYSIRIYEVLKSNLFKKQVVIELEELKKMLGAKEKSYSVYQNFKNKAIIKAQEELKEKTDISFEFEEIKTGRKVTSLKFYIKSNIHPKIKPLDEVSAALDSNTITEDEKTFYEAINAIKSMFKEKIDNLDAKKLLDTAKGNINIIKEKYDLAQRSNKIDNLVGWMIAAIKEDYKAQGKEKVDIFNNYQQRTYDFNKLEKELLSWEKNYDTNGGEYEQEKINQD